MDKLDFKEWLLLNETYYGNYCGPGPRLNKECDKLADGSPLPQPKNTVDSLCKAHDIEYCKCNASWRDGVLGQAGSSCSRQADRILTRNLEGLLDKLHGAEKIAGNVIMKYFLAHDRLQHRDQNQTRFPPGSPPPLAVGVV